MKRCPIRTPYESVIEVRQVAEFADLGENLTPELREQEARIHALAAANTQR